MLYLAIPNAILFWQHSLSFDVFSANHHLHLSNPLFCSLQKVNAGNVVPQILPCDLADLSVLIRSVLKCAFQSLYNNTHKLFKYLVFFGLLEFDVFDVELQYSKEKLLAVREGVKIAFQDFANIDISEIFQCQFCILNNCECDDVDVGCKSGQNGLIQHPSIDELFISYLHLDVSQEYVEMSCIRFDVRSVRSNQRQSYRHLVGFYFYYSYTQQYVISLEKLRKKVAWERRRYSARLWYSGSASRCRKYSYHSASLSQLVISARSQIGHKNQGLPECLMKAMQFRHVYMFPLKGRYQSSADSLLQNSYLSYTCLFEGQQSFRRWILSKLRTSFMYLQGSLSVGLNPSSCTNCLKCQKASSSLCCRQVSARSYILSISPRGLTRAFFSVWYRRIGFGSIQKYPQNTKAALQWLPIIFIALSNSFRRYPGSELQISFPSHCKQLRQSEMDRGFLLNAI